ncbi:hypothetical protein E1B28_006151 [Marasmius oreades]|uniref:Oxidoreductase AflY n=1 Tax=Marasmius oreades TaxID=181124 RepID=A0A9P7S7E0_9AGAR|nr:uncharacterized protein E1B28_006151 [Marasmius oreades]KAG7095398.1 hypothetical protein E1B28_006151 [Marasmius oreades]
MAPQPFDLWPAPSLPPRYSPSRLPGITPDSTSKLRELLRKNHEQWHIFYDGEGRHNHISHHLLASWSLGADKEVLQAGYNLHSQLQRPLKEFQPGEVITKETFYDHLGERSYYQAYADFFTLEVEKNGGFTVLEEYVFSDKVNFGTTNKEGEHPVMLGRFMGGLLHPIIHVGYGAEFSLPGMFIEGLAQIAVTSAPKALILPQSLFTSSSSTAEPLHALTILARVLQDERFDIKLGNGFATVTTDVRASCGSAPVEYATAWLPDAEPSSELVQRKIDEIQWTVTIICTISGFKKGQEYTADFIAMHLVTSSLFVQSLVPSLSPASQALFLRSYFAVCLTTWATLGRPSLDIMGYFAADIAHPLPTQSLSPPSPSKFVLPSPNSIVSVNPNPWLSIIQRSIVHPDDHVVKFQRALYHYASKFGPTPAGYFANTELPDADQLDGTLFVRAAELTIKKLGREIDELPKNFTFWDRTTFRPEGASGNLY